MNNETKTATALVPISQDLGVEGGVALQEMFGQVLAKTDLKPATRRVYGRAIKDFFAWLDGKRITGNTLVEYKISLDERAEIRAATKNLYLSAVRTVFRRLFEMGATKRDLSKSVRSFKLGTAHKNSPISDEDVQRVFAYLEEQDDGQRMLALMNLLFRQGLRQAEAARIQVEDINFADATLKILGKGRDDEELVPMHPRTADALQAWLDQSGIRSGYIFPSRKNKGSHLTVNMLYRMVMDLHKATGVKTNPHGWRKAFTSTLIDSGMNLLAVQKFTRHKSMTMLQRYYDRQDTQKLLPDYYEALNGHFGG